MSKRTLILILVLIAVTAALLAIALTPKQPAPLPPQAPPVRIPAAQTILRISNSPVSSRSAVASISAVTSLYATDVTIETGSNKVTAVQLELSFDPKLITNLDIKPGPFFQNPVELLKRIDNQRGTISYALGIGIVGGRLRGMSGKGTVATISFQEIGLPGQYVQIIFLPKTLVTGEGTARSVLKSSVSASFPIGGVTTVLTPPAGAGTGTGSSRPVYSP